MMPPRCKICGKNHRDHDMNKFELLYFKLSPEQAEMKRQMKEKRMVGHPPGAHWFCLEHAAAMKPFTHLEYGEARKELSKPLGIWTRLKSIIGLNSI